ncbi:hypothetical protein ACFOEK_12100 [Litoribrevibacter euphylliae]|uniref:Uncharacterized protein n=1 Tax=Litoribrevibacter euphylliae TaxID=1834034 RepID=A0ABV7HDA4_9GAMM
MKTSFVSIFSVAAISVTAFASVSLTFPASANEISYKVEVVNQGQEGYEVKTVRASQQGNTTEVFGKLKGKPKSGHVDIAAYSSSGELLAETTTSYFPSSLSSKRKKVGGARFSTDVLPKLPSDSVIKVAFHRDENTSSMPKHRTNTAK